jgi:hypothetical protein
MEVLGVVNLSGGLIASQLWHDPSGLIVARESGHTPDRPAGHGLDPSDRSPHAQPAKSTPSGMGRSPASSRSMALAL